MAAAETLGNEVGVARACQTLLQAETIIEVQKNPPPGRAPHL
jgi:hypothetical protein